MLRWLGFLTLASLLFFYGLFLTHKIDLTTADLGRHLKNGELIWQNPALIVSSNLSPLTSNFYSYTHPDYPVINHHWLAGLLFYAVHRIAGFAGLSVFFIGLSLVTFLLFFAAARRAAGFAIASAVSLIAIPLLAERTEIRPEAFSYLFAGIFFFILTKYRHQGLPFPWLICLPILQILWANLHIYFFLGPLLVAVFLLEKSVFILSSGDRGVRALFENKDVKILTFLFVAVSFAAILNPFGLKGALAPFNIFREYGYDLVENKPVWFLEKLGFQNPTFFFFKIALILLAASFVFALIYRHRPVGSLSNGAMSSYLLAALTAAAALLATRNFALFGYFFIPIAAANFSFLKPPPLKAGAAVLGAAILVIAVFLERDLFRRWPYWRESGIGLENGTNNPALFFKANGIQGPIFNNYDIGSFLVYHLYPEKVFVENRPEAYPADFFKKTLIPMQYDDGEWLKQEKNFGFNAIFVSRYDNTPWGRTFLQNRLKDKDWALVFAGDRALIFLKRNKLNDSVISEFAGSL